MNRDTTISISKGIAIILMVIAHAEAPGWLSKFIF
jgi:fucose 4-O-acetylase-like acetyltransferase